MDNPIIILGGMGPQASLRLHELLLKKSEQFHGPASDEFPAILHASIPVPDFIASPANYEEAVTLVQHTCSILPLANAGVVGMACNTAHLMVNRLPLDGVNFVSMIDAVVAQAEELHKPTSIGLLASPHTIQTGLYANAFKKRGIEVVLPDKRQMNQLHRIITGVIEGQSPQRFRAKLSAIGADLNARGATGLLLGCTELPLIGIDSELPVIDSLDALANAMLEKYYDVRV